MDKHDRGYESIKGKIVYCFNARSGNTTKYKSVYRASKELGYHTHSTILTAIKNNTLSKGCLWFSYSNITPTQKKEAYARYWRSQEIVGQEVWVWAHGIQISNNGRVRGRDGEFIIPRYPGQNRHMTVHANGKKYNLARLVAEVFIVGRPLKNTERVIRLGGLYDYKPHELKVIDASKQRDIWKRRGWRRNGIAIAKVDETGEAIEIYRTISEAGRANFISQSAISKALKEDRPILGLRFKRVEECL